MSCASAAARVQEYAGHVYDEHVKLIISGVLYMLRPHTMVTLGLSLVSVWFCAPSRLALAWDANFQMIVVGLVFPMTFSITENFKRRERCADFIAQMKSSAVCVYWAHRDWPRGVAAGGAPADANPRRPSLATQPASTAVVTGHARNALDVLREFMANVRMYLMTPDEEPAHVDAYYARAVRNLSTLHVLNEVLGDAAGYTKGCEGGMSRMAQYTRMLLTQLEQLRILRAYAGSPYGMRFFVALMAHISPLVLAPYFRNFCSKSDSSVRASISRSNDYAADGKDGGPGNPGWGVHDSCAPGYFSAAIYCAVLCTLYAVLCDIEDLYDGRGLDDVHFNLDVEIDEAAALAPFGRGGVDMRTGVPMVSFAYDDVLGPRNTAAVCTSEDAPPRVFAHRDPTQRISTPAAAAEPPQPRISINGSRHGTKVLPFDAPPDDTLDAPL